MLKKILSISGKPGLYELISQGKNCIIVETLSEPKKKMPVFSADKVMSLGDIAIYTTGEEKPLSEVFESIKAKYNANQVDVKAMDKAGNYREVFAEVLPDFDEDRVRTSDIKKVFAWYNTLIAAGFEKFVSEEEKAEEKTEEAPAE